MKLIRDKLDQEIEANRLAVVNPSSDEYKRLLIAKLDEECDELKESNYSDPTEYADILEVLFALADTYGVDHDEILSQRVIKKHERGAFKKGLILKD